MTESQHPRLFELAQDPEKKLGQVPEPIETATYHAVERATRHIFGENFDEMGDPSVEITPQDVTSIVHITLAELATRDVLKLNPEDYEERQ